MNTDNGKRNRRYAQHLDNESDWKSTTVWLIGSSVLLAAGTLAILIPIVRNAAKPIPQEEHSSSHPVVNVQGKILVTVSDRLYQKGITLSDLSTYPQGVYARLSIASNGQGLSADDVTICLASVDNVKLKPAIIQFDDVKPGETVRATIELRNLARDIKLVTLDLK